MTKERKLSKLRARAARVAPAAEAQSEETAATATPAPPTNPAARAWLLALPIALLVALAYAPIVDAGFIWDDDDYVELNELLVEDGGLAQIWNPLSPRNPQYYPLVFTTFRIERALFGLDPTVYHVDNVLLHVAGSLLLFLLLRRVRLPGAWLAAAVFALHPVNVESVAWIAERKNVLSGCFYFLAANAYLTFDATRRKRWYAVTLACFFLALTAKTITASLPIALGILLWWKRGRIEWRQVATLVPLVALGFVMGMLTRNHEYAHVITENTSLNDLTGVDRVLIAGRALWFYPAKVFWPKDFAFIYERWRIDPGSAGQWVFPLLAAAFIAGAFVAFRRGRLPRGPFAAILFYGATIFPALGFVNVAPMRFSFVADHFQYLASIGSILIGTALLRALLGRLGAERAFPVAAAVIAIGLAALSRQQVRHYHDLGTLWGHTAKLSPHNPMVLNSYANWLRKQQDPELRRLAEQYNERALEHGDGARESELLALANLASIKLADGDFAAALGAADRALALKPDFVGALSVRGRALWRLGRLDEAERALKAILVLQHDAGEGRHAWDLRRRTDDASVNLILGLVQRDLKHDADATASFERALEINPDLYEAYISLGDWHGLNDRLERAIEAYNGLLAREAPTDLRARAQVQLGLTYKFLGRADDAARAFAFAVELVPADPRANQARIESLLELRRFGEAIEALQAAIRSAAEPSGFEQRLAWVLATAPEARDRDGVEALAIAERLARTAPSALTLSVLAAAQAELGDFDAALTTLGRARAGAAEGLSEQLAQQELDYGKGAPTRWR